MSSWLDHSEKGNSREYTNVYMAYLVFLLQNRRTLIVYCIILSWFPQFSNVRAVKLMEVFLFFFLFSRFCFNVNSFVKL